MSNDHPFYRMKDFKLRYHDSIEFHESLLLSSNFFNPNWSGLRRVKNVVMVSDDLFITNCCCSCYCCCNCSDCFYFYLVD